METEKFISMARVRRELNAMGMRGSETFMIKLNAAVLDLIKKSTEQARYDERVIVRGVDLHNARFPSFELDRELRLQPSVHSLTITQWRPNEDRSAR